MKADALAKSLQPLVAAGLSSPWWKDDRARHCAYCGIKMRMKADGTTPTSPTRDHLVPSCHDGPDLTVPACLSCNRAKGAKSLPEFLAGDYFRERRNPKHGKAWAEHELWAVYSVAVLRRTHELMRAAVAQPAKAKAGKPREAGRPVNASG